MARTRSFDPEEALASVMRVFWQQGFAETSYDDLVKASGVSRKGLYTAFGDKEALFIASLRYYRKTIFKDLFADLERSSITIEDIIKILENLGQLAASEGGSIGCFMANTAADETLTIPEVKQQVDAHLKAMSQSFQAAFQRAGMPKGKSTTWADYFTGMMQGLFLLAHARADKSMIQNYIRVAISVL